MAGITQYQPYGLPGTVRSFVAKAEVVKFEATAFATLLDLFRFPQVPDEFNEGQKRFFYELEHCLRSVFTGDFFVSGNLYSQNVLPTDVIASEHTEADVTGDNEAATIAGQGALALLDNIDTAQIVDTAVTEDKLAALSVSLGKMAADSVDKDKLTIIGVDSDGKLVLGQIGSGDADDISESATKKWAAESGADITGGHTAADISGQGNLATLDTVDTAQIDNDAINAAKILAGAVGTAELTALAVTASKIAALAIESDKVAANAITATKILVASLGAIAASLGTVTAGIITGTTITGGTIRTAVSGRRIKMDADGIKFMSAVAGSGKVGTAGNGGDNIVIGTTANGGDNEIVGAGYLARFYNITNGVPFYIQSEQAVADIHHFNRTNTPAGAAEVGDVCVVLGKHRTCTVSGAPGTWVVTGDQTA